MSQEEEALIIHAQEEAERENLVRANFGKNPNYRGDRLQKAAKDAGIDIIPLCKILIENDEDLCGQYTTIEEVIDGNIDSDTTGVRFFNLLRECLFDYDKRPDLGDKNVALESWIRNFQDPLIIQNIEYEFVLMFEVKQAEFVAEQKTVPPKASRTFAPLIVNEAAADTLGKDAAWRARTLNQAAQKAGVDAQTICNTLLGGNAKNVSQPVLRTGTLYVKADNTVALQSTQPPMIGDEILNADTKQSIAFIHSLRSIEGSTYVLKLNSTDLITPGETKIQLKPFALDMSPNCKKTASSPDVIATFVSDDKDGMKFFNFAIQGGALLIARGEDEELYGSGVLRTSAADYIDSEAIFVACFVILFETQLSKYATQCPGGVIDGKCQGLVEDTLAPQAGQIPSYKKYDDNRAQFQQDLALALTDLDLASQLCAYFIVSKLAYDGLRTKHITTWSKLKVSDCAKLYMQTLHRNVFESYLMQLNDLWQTKPMSDSPKMKAAIMWLLFYTQLPVFVAKLSDMMISKAGNKKTSIKASMNGIVKEFHAELTKHLSGFLPKRDASNAVVQDNIRTALSKVQLGVQEQMSAAVVRNAPDCF